MVKIALNLMLPRSQFGLPINLHVTLNSTNIMTAKKKKGILKFEDHMVLKYETFM